MPRKKAPKSTKASGSSISLAPATSATSSTPESPATIAPAATAPHPTSFGTVHMSLGEQTLSAFKTGLEFADVALKGIHPGVEAITGVPLKLILVYEKLKTNDEGVKEVQTAIKTLQTSILDPIITTCRKDDIDVPRSLAKRIAELNTALNELSKALPETQGLGWLPRLIKKDKIADLVAKAGKDFAKLIENFIAAGQITEEVMISDLRQKHDNLIVNSLPLASARHSSSNKAPCLPGTRDAVRKALRTHLQSSSSRYIFLRGSPGTGKSAITMTLAQELEEENELAASFFFDKRTTQDGTFSFGMLVTTLARQMSRVDRAYHRALYDALESNPEVVKDRPEIQVKKLIIEPLRESAFRTPTSSTSTPFALMFDALDECGGAADLDTVLDLLTALDSLPAKYRIFFSSRPQPAILRRFPFNSTSVGLVEDLDGAEYQGPVADDILRFIETRFRDLVPDVADPTWPPTPDETEDFSGLSQGLFELAALRVRRVESAPSKGLRPRRVFDMVIKEARGLPRKPLEQELESEYLRIIDWVYSSRDSDLDEAIVLYRQIVGAFVSLRVPLGLEALSRMLDMSEGDVRSALHPLSSVLFVDRDPAVPIRCYHATFREFLTTKSPRLTEFHREFLFEGPQHSLMLQLCVARLSQELRQGMLPEIHDHDCLDDIEDFDLKVSNVLPPHLRYCCLYWNHHLQLTSTEQVSLVEKELGVLFGSCLLNWIEAMSLLREMDEAIPILWRTTKWYRSQGLAHSPDAQLAGEARGMLAEFSIPIRDNPRHIYISAFPQMPPGLLILQKYQQSRHPVQLLFGDPVFTEAEDFHWKVEYPWAVILSVALSPSGSHLLVGWMSGADNISWLDLRSVDDGSLVRSYRDGMHRVGSSHCMMVGFVSEETDTVVTWGPSECYVHHPDGSAVSVPSRLTDWNFSMAVTKNTLAFWNYGPSRLCTIDANTWEETKLFFNATSANDISDNNTQCLDYVPVSLAFSHDSASLIEVRSSGHAVVWNWKIGEVRHVVKIELPDPAYGLFLFSASSPYARFAIWLQDSKKAGDGVQDSLPLASTLEAVLIPLSDVITNPLFPTHSTACNDTVLPLPHFSCIAQPASKLMPLLLASIKDSLVVALVDSQMLLFHLSKNDLVLDHILSPSAGTIVETGFRHLRARPAHERVHDVPEYSPIPQITASAISSDGRFVAYGYGAIGHQINVHDLDCNELSFPSYYPRGNSYNPVDSIFLTFVLDNTHLAIWTSDHVGNMQTEFFTLIKIGNMEARMLYEETTSLRIVGHPVLSPTLSMTIELGSIGGDRSHDRALEFILTKFAETSCSRRRLDPCLEYPWTARDSDLFLLAFSPNEQYVGITDGYRVSVWSTGTGVLVFFDSAKFSDPLVWAINNGLPSTVGLASRRLVPTLLDPINDAVFEKIHRESTRGRNSSDDLELRFVPWKWGDFLLAKDGYVQMGSKQRFWIHSTFHPVFYSSDNGDSSEWIPRGGDRILVGGRRGVPPVVLDLGRLLDHD